MKQVVLIAHNIRSAVNVGSLLRTADGLGLKEVILSGYTPYPVSADDDRLPHIARRVEAKIHKAALGAEQSVRWQHSESLTAAVQELRKAGYEIAALEQSVESVTLGDYQPPAKLALIVGSEVGGLDKDSLQKADVILEIPMRGRKESFNVAAAAAMALYHLTAVDK